MRMQLLERISFCRHLQNCQHKSCNINIHNKGSDQKQWINAKKKNPPRKRRKLQYEVCHEVFNDDYRLTNNRKYHSDMLKQNKLVRYKEANAPENPFVAAASASRKKAPSSSSTSETLRQPGKSSLFC